MVLAGEQNCTAQRPLVTQIKGDSAEGERAVRVFLLPEKWGRCVGLILPLPPPLALPRCSTPEQGEELCLPRSLVNEVTVTRLALLSHSSELCFADWGSFNRCLHFVITTM